MKALLFVASVVAVLSFSACGGGSSASCDFRTVPQGSGNGPESRCQEYTGGFVAISGQFKLGCTTASGTYTEAICPRQGILFGCDLGVQADSSHPIDWYYSGAPDNLTADKAAQQCGGSAVLPAP